MKDFEALGLVQTYSSSFESYEEIWIYGARLEHTFDRMSFVCERIAKKTLGANRIYILAGQRLLDPQTENIEVWQRLTLMAPSNYPCTETRQPVHYGNLFALNTVLTLFRQKL